MKSFRLFFENNMALKINNVVFNTHVKAILSTSVHSLSNLASMADNIVKVADFNQISCDRYFKHF